MHLFFFSWDNCEVYKSHQIWGYSQAIHSQNHFFSWYQTLFDKEKNQSLILFTRCCTIFFLVSFGFGILIYFCFAHDIYPFLLPPMMNTTPYMEYQKDMWSLIGCSSSRVEGFKLLQLLPQESCPLGHWRLSPRGQILGAKHDFLFLFFCNIPSLLRSTWWHLSKHEIHNGIVAEERYNAWNPNMIKPHILGRKDYKIAMCLRNRSILDWSQFKEKKKENRTIAD